MTPVAVPLLTASGLDRTLRGVGAVLALGLIAVVGSAVLLNDNRPLWAAGLFTLGASSLFGGAIFAIRRIRCPSCKLRWIEYAFGSVSWGHWLSWLLTFDRCPRCASAEQPGKGISSPSN